jgi:hypothetical protein
MGRAVRAQVWQRLRARRHWVIAFPAHAWGVAARVLAAVDAGVGPGDPPVPVDRRTIDLTPADATDDIVALEPMVLMAIPRAALRAETLQACIRRAHGLDIPVAQLLQAPLLIPVRRDVEWPVDAQIQALYDWLHARDAGP